MKLSELDEWKDDEGTISRELEEIRLQTSTLEQKDSFDQENLSRLLKETKALETEKAEIGESLAQNSREMEARKQSIEELKKEAENSQEQEAQAKVRLEEMQKNKEEKNSSHKEFFEKRDELSGQISLLDKECCRSCVKTNLILDFYIFHAHS